MPTTPAGPAGLLTRFHRARWVLAVAGLVLGLQCFLFWPYLSTAVPLDEEWAMTDASLNGGAASWFTRGFAEYFVAYPEWDHRGTDLLRPLGNALYALVYALGGDHRTLLFLLYAGHAACVTLLWRYGRRRLGLGRPMAAVAAGLAALSPALLSIPPGYHVAPALQYPVYGLEIWCALLMLVAFLGLVAGRWWVYAVFATLALLMKESALPLPVAALACAGLWWRPGAGWAVNGRAVLVLMLPLLAWLFVRVAIFQPTGFHAVMVEAHGPGVLAKRFLKAALVWPTAMFRDTPGHLLADLHPRSPAFAAAVGEVVGVLLNLLFWVATVVLAKAAFFRARAWGWNAGLAFTRDPAVALLILAASNLGFVLVVGGQELRYGYLSTIAAPPALVVLALRAGTRWSRAAAGALALAYTAMALVGCYDIRQNLKATAVQSHRQMHRAGDQLVWLLKALPPGARRVYLVNDWTVGFSNTPSFARVAGIHVPLVRLNDVTDTDYGLCTPAEARRGYTIVRRSRDGAWVEVDVRTPPCLDLWFHSVNTDFAVPLDARNQARRGPLVYSLPEAHVIDGAGVPSPGQRMLVSVPFEPGTAWVVFDFVSERYVLASVDEEPLLLPRVTTARPLPD